MMRTTLTAMAILAAVPGVAGACVVTEPFSPTNVNQAPVVVVGRISHYAALSNYGRFDIAVDQVLKGAKHVHGASLSVTMARALVGQPWAHAPSGAMLIALQPPFANGYPEPGKLTVLVDGCGGPFVMPAGSDEATQVRRVLKGLPPVAPKLPERAAAAAQPLVFVAAPVFAVRPTWANMHDYYPARAREDEIEGKATIQCAVMDRSGRLVCITLDETPRNYGFGTAAVRMFQDKARVKADIGSIGEIVRVSWKWVLR